MKVNNRRLTRGYPANQMKVIAVALGGLSAAASVYAVPQIVYTDGAAHTVADGTVVSGNTATGQGLLQITGAGTSFTGKGLVINAGDGTSQYRYGAYASTGSVINLTGGTVNAW